MNAQALAEHRAHKLNPHRDGHRAFLTVCNDPGRNFGRYRWSCLCGLNSKFWHRSLEVARYYADGHLLEGKRGLHRPVGSMPR